MQKCLVLFVWILTSFSSVLCVLMFLGMSKRVNVMLCLMYVSSTPLLHYSVRGCFGCCAEFGFLYSYDVWLCCVCELSKLLLFVCDVVDV